MHTATETLNKIDMKNSLLEEGFSEEEVESVLRGYQQMKEWKYVSAEEVHKKFIEKFENHVQH